MCDQLELLFAMGGGPPYTCISQFISLSAMKTCLVYVNSNE